jgi:hypothetical protein
MDTLTTINVPYILGHSVLVVLWWISLWILAEEMILLISQDKRHKKMIVCITIIIFIIFYCYVNKQFSLQM